MPLVESGARIDQYVIEELVATSATASIYRAVDSNTNLRVALKVPHLEVEGDPLFYDRFCRERDICTKLDHPSIVKIVPNDQASDLYIVTEWLDGRLLRQVLHDETKLSADRAVKLAIAICEALEYIHAQGVAHRDLKPENIMVGPDDSITLLDFGIASQAGARRLTFGKLSQVMGTPDYVSPEQIKGKRGDARSDVYALGVILYEMLTGKTPFTGNNPFVIMNSRLVNNPVPPRDIDPGISPQLQEIIYRALERDPKNRYSSAGEFSWDLRHQRSVTVANRTELQGSDHKRKRLLGSALVYGLLAIIPLFVFCLLLYVSHHE